MARSKRAGAIAGLAMLVLAVGLADTAHAVNRERVRRPGPPRVLLMGDSITASYQDETETLLARRGYQVIKAGRGGTGLLDADHCTGQWQRFVAVLVPAVRYASYTHRVPRLNDAYRRVGGTKTGFVDAWTDFGGAVNNPSLHAADQLHLNQAGQDRMAALVANAVG